MRVYEVTAAGFDGSNDETDHLVYWVGASSEDLVLAAIADTGSTYCGDQGLPYSTLYVDTAGGFAV